VIRLSAAFDNLRLFLDFGCDIFTMSHPEHEDSMPILLVRSGSPLAVAMTPLSGGGPYHCRRDWETFPLEAPERLSIVAGILLPDLSALRQYTVESVIAPPGCGGWMCVQLDEFEWFAELKNFAKTRLN